MICPMDNTIQRLNIPGLWCRLAKLTLTIVNKFLFIITFVPYLTICPPLSLPFYFAPCLPLKVTSMFNMYLKYQQTKNYYDEWVDCSWISYSLFRGHHLHKKSSRKISYWPLNQTRSREKKKKADHTCQIPPQKQQQ